MELWLMSAMLAYLSFAISTSIDKSMMNRRLGTITTNTFKMLFDALVLAGIGIFLFDMHITVRIVMWAALLGSIYGAAGIAYYRALQLSDVEIAIPYMQSSQILLVFIASLILLGEKIIFLNSLGVLFILLGIYCTISDDGIKVPKANKGTWFMLFHVLMGAIYVLLVKTFLSDAQPIALAIMMYVSTTAFMLISQAVLRIGSLRSEAGKTGSLHLIKSSPLRVFVASFFGATGTLLLYTALSYGNASQVFPVAGLQSVFIFIIATIFLKEKFYLHRLIGTFLVVMGIFFVAV